MVDKMFEIMCAALRGVEEELEVEVSFLLSSQITGGLFSTKDFATNSVSCSMERVGADCAHQVRNNEADGRHHEDTEADWHRASGLQLLSHT